MSHSAPAQAIPAIEAEESERAGFLRRTYGHLALAVLAFAILESYLLSLPIAAKFTEYASNRIAWGVVLLAFMAVSGFAEHWARSEMPRASQYFGLGLYVVAEACIFVPLLTMARAVSPEIIPMAAIFAGVLMAALTAICFTTRANFSGLRAGLMCGGFLSLGLIFCSIIFGFSLGMLFSGGMIVLACGMILYTTSRVQHEFTTRGHVPAALCLFAAVALLFWYVTRILIQIYLRAQK
jgi:FtsH-binding integral membrane protein